MKVDVFENYSELNLLLRNPYHSDGELTFVDVGAYRGGFSRAFAKKGWRVIAFEPEPTNYHYCCLNTSRFPLVSCVQKAVSDVSGQRISFYIDERYSGRGSIKRVGQSHISEIFVETTRLDDALEDMNIEQVTVLKCDTEGADFLCLKGFDFDRYHPEIVMVEFLDARSKEHFDYTHHDMVAYMRDLGYRAYISELGPLTKSGRTNQIGNSAYQFVAVSLYPLDYEPALGNIIFVSEENTPQFEHTLSVYLEDLKRIKYLRFPLQYTKSVFTKIPCVMKAIYKLRRMSGYRL